MKKLLSMTLVAIMMLVGVAVSKANTASKTVSSKATVVKTIDSPELMEANAGDYWVYVCGDGVRIRATPSLKGKIIGKAYWNYSFRCIGYVPGGNGRYGWYKIIYGNRIAYISEQYARP